MTSNPAGLPPEPQNEESDAAVVSVPVQAMEKSKQDSISSTSTPKEKSHPHTPAPNSERVAPANRNSRHKKFSWGASVSFIMQAVSLAIAFATLMVAWYAFKVPMEREQATKVSVAVENKQCSGYEKSGSCGGSSAGEYYLGGKVINSSDAPIYNVSARITPTDFDMPSPSPEEFQLKPASISSENNKAYQVLPNDSTDILVTMSSVEGKTYRVISYKAAFSFTDAQGKTWYSQYEVKDATGEDLGTYKSLTDLTDKKPKDWDEVMQGSK